MKLRIHHFYDMIRDFGRDEKPEPHVYGHAYHEVFECVTNKPHIPFELVLACDAVCKECIRMLDGHCEDKIDHRIDFQKKEAFNDHIDSRILQACELYPGAIVTPSILLAKMPSYLDDMDWIYQGNDRVHTLKRKEMLMKGMRKIKKRFAAMG